MTERLYYTDAYGREFDATITAVEHRVRQALVRLDRTGFYPTSGGQPFDTGVLGGWPVVDVIDDDSGDIVHMIDEDGSGDRPDRQALRPGARVHGAIDWPRRFDHMQQHTGQHILSAAFERLFAARTVSFHLGADASTIDLARELTTADIAAAEDEANRIVWENRPVAIRFVGKEEAARLPLRKEVDREGTLRLIAVEDFDLSACGGTHVSATGSIGVIAVGSIERFKGGQRVEFLCGNRALGRFHALRDTAAACGRLLSVGPTDLPSSIERLQTDLKEQRRTLSDLQTELARHQAEALAAAAEPTPMGRVVRQALALDAGGLKALASSIVSKPGMIVVLTSTSASGLVVVARSKDVGIASNAVVAELTAAFGGRGGGKPDLAQAGGLSAQPQQVLDAALARIQQA